MSVGQFNSILAKAVSICSSEYTLTSRTMSDEYGIKMHQPLGVQHIMSLILYVQEPKYAKLFRQSYFGDARNVDELSREHCGNWYWFGRYLYEAIEFFGDTFSGNSGDDKSRIYMPASVIYKFPSFAFRLGMARSISTSKKNALYVSGDSGSVIELIPKYNGTVTDML